MTTLQTYLAAKLAEDGYSGLAGENCGCTLEDLFACDGPAGDCVPGYRHECAECPHVNCNDGDSCPVEDGGTGCCISASKDWPEATE